jgi:hypothetical protein
VLKFKRKFQHQRVKLQHPPTLPPNDSHIQEDMKHQQHNSEILISCIFKDMLSSSGHLENGDCKLIHNICNYLPIFMVPYCIGSPSSLTMLQKPQTHIICVLSLNVGFEQQKHCCWKLQLPQCDGQCYNMRVTYQLSHFQCNKIQPLFSVPYWHIMMQRIDSGSLHDNVMSVLPCRQMGIILN